MDTDTWVAVLVAALSSTLLAAAIQLFGEPLRLKWQHRWNLAAKREDAQFNDERRRLDAHLSARDRFLQPAEQVLRWTEEVLAEAVGPEIGYFDPEGAPEDCLAQLPDVLLETRQLAAGHPTTRVRKRASSFDQELRGFYGDMQRRSNGTPFPSFDDQEKLYRLRDLAAQLVEVLHEPRDLASLAP